MECRVAGAATAMATADRLLPFTGKRYRLERELGRGAMATVYLAHDQRFGRSVALKVLNPELAYAVGAERFLREIEIAAQFNHPHILPLFDSGEADGLVYYVTPFINGQSLRHRLADQGPLPVRDAVEIGREVAAALDYAHARGIVHRDIKPENILLHEGRALVADFGIARAIQTAEDGSATESGITMGTPRYMSPEQAAGAGDIDGRSDIYSLACVVYEMLAGRPPFTGPNAQAILARHTCDPPPSVRIVRPDVPTGLEAALARALAKSASERFATAGAFADALATPQAFHRRARPGWLRRYGMMSGMAAAAMVYLTGDTGIESGTARLRERDWVAVADFDGPPGDPTLADAVRELVTAELNQSRFISTMPRDQLNSAMRAAGIAETTTIDVGLARDLAFRSAVKAVLTGSVQQVGPGHYAVVLRVVEVDDGGDLVSATAAATPDDLVATVQRLAREVRGQLGERRSQIEADRPLLEIATPSLAAYRKYADALRLKQGGDLIGSNRLLGEAVQVDTGFASAWAMMAMNYLDARNLDSARAAMREAVRRPERLSDANRYRLRADAAYTLDYDLADAVRWYDLYLQEVPHSVGGRNNRALYLSLLGRYEEALGEFQRAVQENPFGSKLVQMSLLNQTAVLVSLGRLRRAREVSRALEGPFRQYAELQLATARDDWPLAEHLAVEPATMPNAPAWLRIEALTTQAAAFAARGAVGDAATLLTEAAEAAEGEQRHWYGQALNLLAVASSRPALSAPLLHARDSSPGGLVMTGLAAAIAGDTTIQGRAILRLRRLPARDLRRLGYGLPAVEGMIDARAQRWSSVTRLRSAARVGEHDGINLDRVGSVLLRWLVADAYARLGQLDSAITYMELAINPRRLPPGHQALRGLVYPFAKHRLALWYDRRGDHEAARRNWRAFHDAISTPDEEMALLESQAVTELARLRSVE
jgi:tetratricopeptide (TPR) repeat protein/tRNA A-37 threonylcarbamoyl transferase component Bud32